MSLSGVKFSVKMTGTDSKATTSGLGEALSQTVTYEKILTFTNGSGALQVSKRWMSSGRSLAASTAETHDLSGSLVDDLGNAVVFTEIKGILIYAAPTNGGNLQVGAATAALVGLFVNVNDIIIVKPGGFFAWGCADATGAAVTATTADGLKVENMDSGAAGVYDILIIGD